MSRLNQAKARKQLRRGRLVARRGLDEFDIIVFDEAQRLPRDLLNQLGSASINAFIHSRAACATCGHRRKDHDGPSMACRRYDQPDCFCPRFAEAP